MCVTLQNGGDKPVTEIHKLSNSFDTRSYYPSHSRCSPCIFCNIEPFIYIKLAFVQFVCVRNNTDHTL